MSAPHSDAPAEAQPGGFATTPRRILVIGCGLIGGSIAGAATRRGDRVWAIDGAAALRVAEERRSLERGIDVSDVQDEKDWTEVFAELVPHLVVLAGPPPVIERQLPDIAAATRSMAEAPRVCDVASVKRPIVELAERVGCPRFVGGHPMAGSERSGVRAADPALFEGRRFVLCPSSTSSADDVQWLSDWVRDLGADPVEMTPEDHDRAVAMVSHLPHLAALTLMKSGRDFAREFDDPDELWALAAGSWRDATRVAASSPELWRSIVEANRGPILEMLDRWLSVLTELRSDLDKEGGRAFDGLEPDALANLRRSLERWLPPRSS